ncbi:MAG TPA: hypothetical protein VFF06_03300 [Polyangia bacterium]|nr:hypothetical protein [Polyangia bacterium]
MAALGAGAGVGVLVSRGRAHRDRPARPASEAERALVAPLAVGAPLDDYQVREIHAVEKGVLRVVLARDAASVNLDVALAGPGANRALASAGPYAIFYSLKNAPDADGQRLAKALAAVIQPNAALPPPPGLTTFEPQQPPPQQPPSH